MTRNVACSLLALLAVGSGCGPSTALTRRGGTCTERPKGCEFELISQRPAQDYQVIGVIDLTAFSVRQLPTDDASFKAAVAGTVCSAGGDGVIPGVNGDGRYVLATVVKWADANAPRPICPVKPKSVPGKGKNKNKDKAPSKDASADAGVSGDPAKLNVAPSARMTSGGAAW